MEKLKLLRKQRNLTQTDVANHLKITVSAYGNYELGQRSPTPETLIKLADFFGVSVDYLLGLDDNTESASVAPLGETLTASERDLLSAFRKLSPASQDLLVKTARTLAGEDISTTTLHKRA